MKNSLEMWLSLKRNRIADSTWLSYDDVVRRFILPYFGEKNVEDVTALDVEMWISTLYGRDLAPSTIKRVFAVFRSFCNKMCAVGQMKDNPCANVEPIRATKPPISFLSAAEISLIHSLFDGEPLMWRVYFAVAIDSGMRRGEMVALRWSDIEKSVVTVKNSAFRVKGEKSRLKPPKNGQIRQICLSSGNVRALRTLQKEQRLYCLKHGIPWTKQCFVFSGDGSMLYPTTPTSWWAKFQKRHGLKHMRLHSLRHTCATLLLAHGVDLKTVSQRLGHKDISTTDIYLHCVGENDERAAGVMNDLLFQVL